MKSESDKIIFLNGCYLSLDQASISIEDRGTLFADGVYEVIRYYAGKPFAIDQHLDRLRRSLEGIRLELPEWVDRLADISLELIARNAMPDAKVYWQITRGQAQRRHEFPHEVVPTVLVNLYQIPPLISDKSVNRWKAILVPDQRWHHCWIKSLMLLPNVLAKQQAAEAGCQEAVMHRDGIVTECTTANLFIVKDETILTHPADQWILAGITRQVVIELVRQIGITLLEQPITIDQLMGADEVFVTGTTTHVASVTELGGRLIGLGKPGKITECIHEAFLHRVFSDCELS